MSEDDVGIVRATPLNNVGGQQKQKPLYLVKVQETEKTRFFIADKLDKSAVTLDIQGVEVKTDKIKQELESLKEIVNEKAKQVAMSFPWAKVCYIDNLSFKLKSSNKENK